MHIPCQTYYFEKLFYIFFCFINIVKYTYNINNNRATNKNNARYFTTTCILIHTMNTLLTTFFNFLNSNWQNGKDCLLYWISVAFAQFKPLHWNNLNRIYRVSAYICPRGLWILTFAKLSITTIPIQVSCQLDLNKRI